MVRGAVVFAVVLVACKPEPARPPQEPVVTLFVEKLEPTAPEVPLAVALDPERIVPRLLNKDFAENAKRRYPGEAPVFEPFVGDLVLAYALELDGGYRYLSMRDVQAMTVPVDQIRTIATRYLNANVPRWMPDLGTKGDPRFWF